MVRELLVSRGSDRLLGHGIELAEGEAPLERSAWLVEHRVGQPEADSLLRREHDLVPALEPGKDIAVHGLVGQQVEELGGVVLVHPESRLRGLGLLLGGTHLEALRIRRLPGLSRRSLVGLGELLGVLLRHLVEFLTLLTRILLINLLIELRHIDRCHLKCRLTLKLTGLAWLLRDHWRHVQHLLPIDVKLKLLLRLIVAEVIVEVLLQFLLRIEHVGVELRSLFYCN